jgi:membrane protein DedA with SNARE-associated domain
MKNALLVFLFVYGLNLIPAFAPPTWMVFSYLGFRYPGVESITLALVGALAATLGRITLARLSHVILRRKLLSYAARENVDEIEKRLVSRPKLTFGIFLFYAFSPLPSNYLFIAYGLTAMSLARIAVPFFLGRSVSYFVLGTTSRYVGQWLSLESENTFSYLGVYFVTTQILLIFATYLFARIDWRALFEERKLRLTRRDPKPSTLP